MGDLDPVLHHPARIAIATRLAVHEHLRFTALKDATGLTPGNLASHLAAMEKAGYVAQRDAIIRLRPGKLVALTDAGRAALAAYTAQLEALLGELRLARR
jgi:DNA-binding MarR family transcriptional regulator